jgi:hypothetical protein
MLNTTKSSPAHLERQLASFFGDTPEWLSEHWFSILVATGIAVGIVLLLHTLRSWGMRLCRDSDGIGTNWYTIFGRTIARTGNFFILMTAIRLVVNVAETPPLLDKTITLLFTVAAAFQAAIWIREVIFGLIEHRTREPGKCGRHHPAADLDRLVRHCAGDGAQQCRRERHRPDRRSRRRRHRHRSGGAGHFR